MINAMQRLGFTQNSSIDHKKLAVDLAEVIVEWEKRRYKEEQGSETPNNVVGLKRPPSVNGTEPATIKRQRSVGQSVSRFVKCSYCCSALEISFSGLT